MKSNLTNVTVPAHVSNYTQGRRGYKICKITPHIMAGVLTAEQCGSIFANSSRNASSNYGIGNDGKIGCYVEEQNRAWTSSSATNDCQAITIEVSNSSTGGNWPISDAAWNSLVNLCVDICRRYNFRLNYDGTSNGSLTRHNMFAATTCPGAYLQGRLPELASVVNAKLDGGQPVPPTPSSNEYIVNTKSAPLNVRNRPNGDIVGSKAKGTIVGVYSSENGWAKIGDNEWVLFSYLKPVSAPSSNEYIVNTTSAPLNVRNKPNGTVVGSKPKGSIVGVYSTENGWAKIGDNEWVLFSYLKKI